MKATLSFNLPEDRQEFEDAVNAGLYRDTTEAVWEKLFRPRHKHGFQNAAINNLLESEPEGDGPLNRLMDELEKLYHECCEGLPGR
jgi:hypothetical protein